MKVKNILKIGLGIFIVILTFSGCVATKPSSYQVEVNKINMPVDEKQKLLNNLLVEKYGKYVNGYQIIDGCVNFNYNVAWMNQEFKNCYEIKNDKIVRQDYSECYYYNKKDTCRYQAINFDTDVKKYTKFLDSIDINNEYNKRVVNYKNNYSLNKKEYDLFIKKFNTEKNMLEKRLATYKHKIIDKSRILPKNLLNKFEFENLKLISNEKDCYNKFKETKNFKNCFNIKGGIKNYTMIKDSGFDFSINNWTFNKNIKDITNPIIYNVNSDIKFNFLPRDYYAENDDIKVHVSSDYYISFKITNKTNEFIEIKNVSLYWDENINSLSVSKNLPPQAISKIAEMNILQIKNQSPDKTKYRKIKNLNEFTNFGVAIQYVIKNKKKNLYKTKALRVKDLYKN